MTPIRKIFESTFGENLENIYGVDSSACLNCVKGGAKKHTHYGPENNKRRVGIL